MIKVALFGLALAAAGFRIGSHFERVVEVDGPGGFIGCVDGRWIAKNIRIEFLPDPGDVPIIQLPEKGCETEERVGECARMGAAMACATDRIDPPQTPMREPGMMPWNYKMCDEDTSGSVAVHTYFRCQKKVPQTVSGMED